MFIINIILNYFFEIKFRCIIYINKLIVIIIAGINILLYYILNDKS